MLILLSPSKSLDFSSPTVGEYTIPEFLDDSSKLIKDLRKLSKEEISSLMKISHKLTELNYERYREFSVPFTIDNAKQAGYAFRGDVYDGLEFEKFDSGEVAYAQEHLRMLSGLYGMLRPLDLIQPYRLEMGIKLKNASGKNLYGFWGDKITEKINEQESDLVCNLASNEYYKVVKPNLLKARVVSPVFKDFKNGGYKVIMLYAKQARGLMAKYIIRNKIDDVESLKGFDLDGYSYSSELSSKNEPVFVR